MRLPRKSQRKHIVVTPVTIPTPRIVGSAATFRGQMPSCRTLITFHVVTGLRTPSILLRGSAAARSLYLLLPRLGVSCSVPGALGANAPRSVSTLHSSSARFALCAWSTRGVLHHGWAACHRVAPVLAVIMGQDIERRASHNIVLSACPAHDTATTVAIVVTDRDALHPLVERRAPCPTFVFRSLGVRGFAVRASC